jgi:hypothetical protein
MTNNDYDKFGQILAKIHEIEYKYSFSKEQFNEHLKNVITTIKNFDKKIYSSFFKVKNSIYGRN